MCRLPVGHPGEPLPGAAMHARRGSPVRQASLPAAGAYDPTNPVQPIGAAMRTVNMHEAKTLLARLVDQVVAGEPFIIAKAGKPVAKVVPLDAPTGTERRRLGFLQGQGSVPDDFDAIGRDEITQLFTAES